MTLASHSSARNALFLMYIWLLSAIVASYLSERKGYGEKLGLAFGLLLTVLGPDHLADLAGEDELEVEEPRPVRPREGRQGTASRPRGRGAASASAPVSARRAMQDRRGLAGREREAGAARLVAAGRGDALRR